ncbi:hypothetical protein ACFL1R_03325, partial [Candidatus Latescibacterota bacterium]
IKELRKLQEMIEPEKAEQIPRRPAIPQEEIEEVYEPEIFEPTVGEVVGIPEESLEPEFGEAPRAKGEFPEPGFYREAELPLTAAPEVESPEEKPVTRAGFGFSGSEVVRGIIMSEILSSPVSLR